MPSTEEILTKYSKAVGFEKFASIQTLIRKGTIEVEGNGKKFNGVIEDYSKKPSSSLTATVVGNLSTLQVFTGNAGWNYEQSTGAKDASPQELEYYTTRSSGRKR